MNSYTVFWQIRKSLKSLHFSPLFFFLSQLIWPLILTGTIFLSYSPLFGAGSAEACPFTGGTDLFSYLVPGIIVIYLYLEYVGLGMGLTVDRDYGVLEPIFLSPVNRLIWLFGTALSTVPAGIISAAGFIASSHLLFGIRLPHPLFLTAAVVFVILSGIPWGGMVCAIFLNGRNSRFLYAVFETPAEFLSGSRFPLTALPAVLSAAALFYPLSHAVLLLRLSWYERIPWQTVGREVLFILALALVYTAAAVFLFRRAEEKGKRDGTLTYS